ncbi:MAG: hypothetical protein JWR19_2199 [Pedosphaera sp.]|nr:hypothetical protein [Pedosphaera sp.]
MNHTPQQYCLGFLFDPHAQHVVLIEKLKPAWMAGKWNGVGGKLERGESPLQAMQREFKEEAGLDIPGWRPFCDLTGDWGVCYCFHDFVLYRTLLKVQTMESEKVRLHCVDRLPKEIVPNLRWLIPMALSFSEGVNPAKFVVQEKYD